MTVKPWHIVAAALADTALVTLFALQGRAAHTLSLTAPGVWHTAWPFLAGLALAWLALRVWRAPSRVRVGVGVWIITAGVGFLLRALTGQGLALAFVLVASGVLAVVLIGWRLLAASFRMLSRTPGSRSERT